MVNSQPDKSDHIQILLSSLELEFLYQALKSDFEYTRQYFNQRRSKFERILSKCPDLSKRVLPSGRSITQEAIREDEDWRTVEPVYQWVLGTLGRYVEGSWKNGE